VFICKVFFLLANKWGVRVAFDVFFVSNQYYWLIYNGEIDFFQAAVCVMRAIYELKSTNPVYKFNSDWPVAYSSITAEYATEAFEEVGIRCTKIEPEVCYPKTNIPMYEAKACNRML
jgi:hypothetical protein